MNDIDLEFNIDTIIDNFKYEPLYDTYIAIESETERTQKEPTKRMTIRPMADKICHLALSPFCRLLIVLC